MKPGRWAVCRWCQEEFTNSFAVTEHLVTCPVRKEVAECEGRAGRELRFDEVIAIRDRKRKELNGLSR
jgi:hypothetical protein